MEASLSLEEALIIRSSFKECAVLLLLARRFFVGCKNNYTGTRRPMYDK